MTWQLMLEVHTATEDMPVRILDELLDDGFGRFIKEVFEIHASQPSSASASRVVRCRLLERIESFSKRVQSWLLLTVQRMMV